MPHFEPDLGGRSRDQFSTGGGASDGHRAQGGGAELAAGGGRGLRGDFPWAERRSGCGGRAPGVQRRAGGCEAGGGGQARSRRPLVVSWAGDPSLGVGPGPGGASVAGAEGCAAASPA